MAIAGADIIVTATGLNLLAFGGTRTYHRMICAACDCSQKIGPA